MHAFIVIILG